MFKLFDKSLFTDKQRRKSWFQLADSAGRRLARSPIKQEKKRFVWKRRTSRQDERREKDKVPRSEPEDARTRVNMCFLSTAIGDGFAAWNKSGVAAASEKNANMLFCLLAV